MRPINKIIAAIDFSDDSKAAAHYAAKLAADVKAELLLTNVVNQRDVDMMELAVKRVTAFSMKKYLNELITSRKEHLAELTDSISEDSSIKVKTNVRVGVPYQALLLEIKENKPDLLIMGTKGRSNLIDIVIGSCAQKLFRRSPIPLLSIRPSE